MKKEIKKSLNNMDEYEKMFFWFGIVVGLILPILTIIAIIIYKDLTWSFGFIIGAICFTISMKLGNYKLKEKTK